MTTKMKCEKITNLGGLNLIPLMMKEKRIWTKDGITIINRYQLATLVRQRKSKIARKLSNSTRLSFQNSLSQISELEQQISKLVNRPTIDTDEVGNGETLPATSKPLLMNTLVSSGKELNATRPEQVSSDDDNGRPDNWSHGDKQSETVVKTTSSDNIKEIKTQNVNDSIPELTNKTKSTKPISIRLINDDATNALQEMTSSVDDNVYDNTDDTFIFYDCQVAHAKTHRKITGVSGVISPRSVSEPRKANNLSILSHPKEKSSNQEHAEDIETCSKGIEVETLEGECSVVILENLAENKRPLGMKNKLPDKQRARDNNGPTNRIKDSCRMFLERQKKAQNSRARQVSSDEAVRGRHRREEEGKKRASPSRIKQSYQLFVDRQKTARSNKPNPEEGYRSFIF